MEWKIHITDVQMSDLQQPHDAIMSIRTNISEIFRLAHAETNRNSKTYCTDMIVLSPYVCPVYISFIISFFAYCAFKWGTARYGLPCTNES